MHEIAQKISKRLKMDAAKAVVFGLLALVLFLAAFYGYSISAAISNTASLHRTQEKLLSVGTELAELESRYLSVKKKINIEYARDKGFVAAQDISYISKDSAKAAISLK